MKKIAFTVAELLIVVVFIGFFMVLTLSATKNTVDKNKTLLKKSYSTLEKTVSELVNDETLYPYDSARLGFKNTDQITIPGTTSKTDPSATIERKFFQLLENQLTSIPISTGCFASYCFETPDGVIWGVGKQDDNNIKVTFDVNGADSPNENVGGTSNLERDRFSIYVRHDGKMSIPDGDAVLRGFLRSQNLQRDLCRNGKNYCEKCKNDYECDRCQTGHTKSGGMCF